jgi:2-C-methyl-D-erythritol 4-phosphate cytidylyltransferase
MLAGFRAGAAPLVMVHDVAHPFVTPALARAVIAAARRHGAAVAAIPATAATYRVAAARPPERLAGELWSIRRPIALPRAGLARGLAGAEADEGLTVILERVGIETVLVPSPSWNVKLTTPDDWALAGAIEATLRPVS